MAATIARICRLELSQQQRLINQRLRSSSRHVRLFHRGDVRHLFSNEVLKVDVYVKRRELLALQFANMEEKFRERMKFYLDSPEKHTIFTDDLNNMIHLLQNKPDDIDLCIRMLNKFNTQNKDVRFGMYLFGPIVMRSLHYLNLPDVAVSLLMNKELREVFNQVKTYIIALDLLYKNKQYEKMKVIFESLKALQLHGSKYPGNGMFLMLAACYHLNTPESYKYARDLISEAQKVDSYIRWKSYAFLAALAIKQTDPKRALEFLSTLTPYNICVKNLQVMALAELDQLDEAFAIVNKQIYDIRHYGKKCVLCQEAMEKLKEAVERNGNAERLQEFQKFEKFLQEGGHLSAETLEALLCIPILPNHKYESDIGNRNFRRNERFSAQKGLIALDE